MQIMNKKKPAPAPTPLTFRQCQERAAAVAPTLRRRLAAFVYESMLLFGVLMSTALVYGIAMGQHHALAHRQGLQAAVFLVLAFYFIWFWSHGGQTLAMKTWHVRLVSSDGSAVSLPRALARYMLGWLWVMPSVAVCWLAGWHESRLLYGAIFAWVVFYAALSWLLPRRQFLHDMLSGTRVIDTRL